MRALDQARLAAPFYSPKQLTAAQAFWALIWFCSPDAEEMWGEEEKWVKDHRLQSVALKLKCYTECSLAAAFALQMWIVLSHHAWHGPTLLHGTHIRSTPGSEALASLFWCVPIKTRSGMCVETWAAWPFSCAIHVLRCKGATTLGEKGAKPIPHVGAHRRLQTFLPHHWAQPAERKGNSWISQILWN